MAVALPTREEFQRIKSSLASAMPSAERCKLLVTGCRSGEGSSTIAAQLAAKFATDGEGETVLVDANMRAPVLHERLKTPRTPGLTDVLGGIAPLQQALVSTSEPNLSLLPAGAPTLDAGRLLANGSFGAVLDALSKRFSAVIVDAPPVLLFPDAALIARAVDAALLVVWAGRTRRHVVLAAKRELEHTGVNIAGVVLNRNRRYIPRWIYGRL